MIQPKALLQHFMNELAKHPPPPPPPGYDSLQNEIASVLKHVVKECAKSDDRLPTASALKKRIPVFVKAGGGTLFDRVDKKTAEVPTYKCTGCRLDKSLKG